MSRAAVAARTFAVSVPAWVLAFSGERGALFGVLFACVSLLAGRMGPREAPGVLLRLAAQLVGLAVALAVLAVASATRPRFGVFFTVAWLAIAAPRLFWRLDARGHAITLAFALLALMGLSRATTRPAFGLAVAAYLAAALLATMRANRGNASILRHPRGLLAPLLVAFVVAGATMAGLGWGLPAAEPAVTQALHPYLMGDGGATSGFGDGEIRLGHVSDITESDEVVMRVFGRADHLRGQVYAEYATGRWRYRKLPVPDETVEGGRVELAAGDAERSVRYEAEPSAGQVFFAPLGTLSLEGLPWAVRDPYGIVRVPLAAHGDARGWKTTNGRVREQAIARPIPLDRHIHPYRGRLTKHQVEREEALGAIAREWTEGAETDAAKMEAIRRRLARDYAYTLKPERTRRGDPTLAFLRESKKGHCEYFASATVLLARALDIPARLVTGYRVFEYNPVGAYFVVRRRDAHAWSEVWIDGRWQTHDTTPPGTLVGESQRESGFVEAWFDLVRRALGAAFERLAAFTLLETVGAAGLIGALLLVWVVVRRRREPTSAAARLEPFELLDTLEAHFRRRLHVERAPHHTLARYARTLRDGGHQEEAALVEACAALRYGSEGDAQALAALVAAYTRSR